MASTAVPPPHPTPGIFTSSPPVPPWRSPWGNPSTPVLALPGLVL
ncbi:MAG: hypothetical protein ACUVSQ_08925 [Pseudanabaenaceae cyanobacterium]